MIKTPHLAMPRRPLAVAVVLALVATVLWWVFTSNTRTVTISADFTTTVGVYPGSEVRLMGVPIGKVTAVTPLGNHVHITMQYDAQYAIPATADAVIVSPSVVSDRFVQLTPAYTGTGPTLQSGINLGLDRTRIPVELDEIYSTAHDLLDALGPQGANGGGAVNRFLKVSAENLRGNGAALNATLRGLAGLSSAITRGDNDFFASVTSLRDLTGTLAANDGDVRAFNAEMAQMVGFLASERQTLSAMLDNFTNSFATISAFIQTNRGALRNDVRGLISITNALVAEQGALERIVRTIPVGLDNLNRTWDPAQQAARTRSNEGEVLANARGTICDAILAVGLPQSSALCQAISVLTVALK